MMALKTGHGISTLAGGCDTRITASAAIPRPHEPGDAFANSGYLL